MQILKCCALLFFLTGMLAFSQVTYTVKSGDTLNQIAQAFKLNVADIVSANQLENPDLIEIDQILIIPAFHNWTDPLPQPIISLSLEPQFATQGEVQTLTLNTQSTADLTISYLGETIPSFQTDDQIQAYLATPVLQEPGQGTLSIMNNNTLLFLPVRLQEGNYDVENINLSAGTSQLLSPEIVRREHALLKNTCANYTPAQLWEGSFQHPVESPEYTSMFGTKRSYNNGPISGFHRGQDYRGQTGTPVYATANGAVSLGERLELYGNTVVLNHGLGICSAYMHLSEIAVTQGQTVQAGELLGYIGATGLVTGSHLHFEIRVNGVPVAPQQWIIGTLE